MHEDVHKPHEKELDIEELIGLTWQVKFWIPDGVVIIYILKRI